MSSNIHGFDFLQTEHKLPNSHNELPTPSIPTQNISAPDHQQSSNHFNKTDSEKIYDVIQFLKAHRTRGCLIPSIIYKSIGVDLSDGGADDNVRKHLCDNDKIRVEEIPDPENPSLTIYTFGYQTKYKNVCNKVGLLAQINRSKHGVLRKDLEDAYEEAKEDLKKLVTAGDVIAVANNEGKDQVLFPRGEPFLVELDGVVDFRYGDLHAMTADITKSHHLPNVVGSMNVGADMIMSNVMRKSHLSASDHQNPAKPYMINIDIDPTNQIRRGEAMWVGGQWFRVSSAVKEGVPLDDQPERAKAPPSVTLRQDLSKKNDSDGYVRRFDQTHLPVDHDLEPGAVENLRKAKMARAQLQRLASAGGGSRGSIGKNAISTLLSMNASADNQDALAKAVANSGAGGSRKRPTAVGGIGRMKSASGAFGMAGENERKIQAERSDQLKKAAGDHNLVYTRVRRHGCTCDVRNMYLSTKEHVPGQDPDGENIHKLMLKYKLLEPNELIRRTPREKKRDNTTKDGKKKKKRYYERKGQRMTNKHLENTDIGAYLKEAADKQQKGESIGDGGM